MASSIPLDFLGYRPPAPTPAPSKRAQTVQTAKRAPTASRSRPTMPGFGPPPSVPSVPVSRLPPNPSIPSRPVPASSTSAPAAPGGAWRPPAIPQPIDFASMFYGNANRARSRPLPGPSPVPVPSPLPSSSLSSLSSSTPSPTSRPAAPVASLTGLFVPQLTEQAIEQMNVRARQTLEQQYRGKELKEAKTDEQLRAEAAAVWKAKQVKRPAAGPSQFRPVSGSGTALPIGTIGTTNSSSSLSIPEQALVPQTIDQVLKALQRGRKRSTRSAKPKLKKQKSAPLERGPLTRNGLTKGELVQLYKILYDETKIDPAEVKSAEEWKAERKRPIGELRAEVKSLVDYARLTTDEKEFNIDAITAKLWDARLRKEAERKSRPKRVKGEKKTKKSSKGVGTDEGGETGEEEAAEEEAEADGNQELLQQCELEARSLYSSMVPYLQIVENKFYVPLPIKVRVWKWNLPEIGKRHIVGSSTITELHGFLIVGGMNFLSDSISIKLGEMLGAATQKAEDGSIVTLTESAVDDLIGQTIQLRRIIELDDDEKCTIRWEAKFVQQKPPHPIQEDEKGITIAPFEDEKGNLVQLNPETTRPSDLRRLMQNYPYPTWTSYTINISQDTFATALDLAVQRIYRQANQDPNTIQID